MTDRERLVEILKYDIESFTKDAENITKEEASLIEQIGNEYALPNSSHPENLTLRNNFILRAIGNYKEESNFVLKAAQLQIIFSDYKKAQLTCDLDESARAYGFATTEDNVVMYDILSENMSRVLTENKQLAK